MKDLNFARFAAEISAVPWEMVPSYQASLFAALVAGENCFEKAGPRSDPRFRNRVQVSENGDIAVMDISGPLYGKVPQWAKEMYGMTDLQDINADIDALSSDSKVRTVIYNLDTPGGMARPSSETAELVREQGKRKRTIAYSGPGSMMCSAGYKIGAACNEIKAADSADMGCIGTYIALPDTSEMYKKFGVKLEMFRDGKYKALGHPGKETTDEERELLKTEVAELSKKFKAFVRENRPGIAESAMEGQTLCGRAAKEAGLIDGSRRNLGLLVADEIRRSAFS